MAQEIAASDAGRANPVTRRLFADVLAGQNQAVLAVEEYQSLIADENTDGATRKAATEKCLALLHSLGRYEEIRTLKKIMDTLSE